MMFVARNQAHLSEFSDIAFAKVREPKEVVWILTAGHVDLYDRIERIPFATLTKLFNDNLH
jgi:hypothetical protein